MKFLADERLYSHTEECLRFLRELIGDVNDAVPRKTERYHMYWYGDFSSKQAFAIKSFLATQDLKKSELWLWLDAENGYSDHTNNPFLSPFLPFLNVMRFDSGTEALDTPLEDRPDMFGVSPSSRSDFFRHIVLFKHGGVYVDMDTMFLRDISPLLCNEQFDSEFCYRWSAHQNYGSSAVMRLRRQSETGYTLLVRCREQGSCHPRRVLRFEDNIDMELTVLPCVFFDPLWPHYDHKDKYKSAPFNRFEYFFRKFNWGFRRKRSIRSCRDFFPGAFTYHWHNFWDVREHEDSYFGFFNREFDQLIREKLGIEIPPIHDADLVRESVMNDRPARQYK